jgi:hypothetical protein
LAPCHRCLYRDQAVVRPYPGATRRDVIPVAAEDWILAASEAPAGFPVGEARAHFAFGAVESHLASVAVEPAPWPAALVDPQSVRFCSSAAVPVRWVVAACCRS